MNAWEPRTAQPRTTVPASSRAPCLAAPRARQSAPPLLTAAGQKKKKKAQHLMEIHFKKRTPASVLYFAIRFFFFARAGCVAWALAECIQCRAGPGRAPPRGACRRSPGHPGRLLPGRGTAHAPTQTRTHTHAAHVSSPNRRAYIQRCMRRGRSHV